MRWTSPPQWAQTDVRRLSSIKRLPLWYWDQVALFWEALFQGAPWPTQLLQVRLVLIHKPRGPKTASDLRPITVLLALRGVFSPDTTPGALSKFVVADLELMPSRLPLI